MIVERIISRFEIVSEELLEEINIDNIGLDTLKQIFNPMENDPLMYNPYTIHAQEAKELANLIDVQFDLDKFFYQVDCFQIQ